MQVGCAQSASYRPFACDPKRLRSWAEVRMDEQRNGERKIREVTREEFVRDGSEAYRYAEEDGSVLITDADGSPYAVLTVPRGPIDFGWE